MNITKEKDGKKLILKVEGRVDSTTSAEFESEAKAELDGVEELVLDFADLSYISSAGLRVLLSLHKTMISKGKMKVINPNDTVSDIFEVTGFSEVLTIE